LDETDRQILNLLGENARLPVADLARATGLARTTAQARLERLEARGIIEGYTLRLGAKAAPALKASILLQIEPVKGPAIFKRLKSLDEVMAVHTTSGRFDVLVDVAAPTTQALDTVIDTIISGGGVIRSESLVHLTTKIKRMA
jgi:DNA-binding Lrp family transcriptional regulator